MKDKNKKTKVLLGVIAILIVTIGITLAFWMVSFSEEGKNRALSSCFSLEVIEGNNDINLPKASPKTDEEGSRLEPYTFTIKNTCNLAADYTVSLEVLENSTLGTQYIKSKINEEEPKLLGGLEEVEETTIDNALEGRILATGHLEPEEKERYSLRLWLNLDVPGEETMAKEFYSKVVVNGSATKAKPLGDVTFAFYKDDEKVEEIPTKEDGYTLDAIKSNCDKNAGIEWDSNRWAPIVLNLTQTRTKCNLYFKKDPYYNRTNPYKNAEENSLLAKILLNEETSTNNVLNATDKIKAKKTPDFSKTATEDEGLYMAEDDLGESYYFRGNTPDNWVSFANNYWRIIRINGDGTIRMIYNGPTNEQTGATTQVTKISFNETDDNSKYVGYMYGDFNEDTQTYANEHDSIIKDYLENEWFDTALGSYTDYLADEIFCNDRSITSGDGIAITYYGPYKRINDNKPELKCPNANDRFAMGTKVGNVDTNGKIAQGKPVGLITADEVMMVGGTTSGSSFYLCTEQFYWTMSPSYFNSSTAREWSIDSPGSLGNGNHVSTSFGVRPVINIGTNVSVSGGNGTTDEPYTLQLN